MTDTPLSVKIIAGIDFLLGLILLGWAFKSTTSMAAVIGAILSSCPCSILAKIIIAVVVLLIILFVKTGVQLLQLHPKGRNDHVSFSALGIFVLIFPLFFSHHNAGLLIFCGVLIAYLTWSIVYLNNATTRKLFSYHT